MPGPAAVHAPEFPASRTTLMARLEAMALQELACAVPLADDTPPAAPPLTCMDWDLRVPGAAGLPAADPTALPRAGSSVPVEPPPVSLVAPGGPAASSRAPLPLPLPLPCSFARPGRCRHVPGTPLLPAGGWPVRGKPPASVSTS